MSMLYWSQKQDGGSIEGGFRCLHYSGRVPKLWNDERKYGAEK